MDTALPIAESLDLGARISSTLRKRIDRAVGEYAERLNAAASEAGASLASIPPDPAAPWRYAVDAAQRAILFWDTLRQRGNDFVERARGDASPVLMYGYEVIVDGRALPRPVNYDLVAIVPPEGVRIDPKKRPYVIIDPRGGHGPGIGGFKEESEVGVALAAGHPVYFVMFHPDPVPGQTLLDVCEAEKDFVRTVRERHPSSPKPVVMGNCQGGWAAMMLAAADPEDMGPVVLIGAPMSYWGGAWQEDQKPNPMRYAGGLLGGSWLASLSADLGKGLFDGAHLVQNFENLNPAHNYWDKYYKVLANADTEPARFLQFERWWSSYYLMNAEEIEWITRNLFIGNRLWSGGVKQGDGRPFDLRDVKSPIVVFASMGDNITPPQQAFNWVADVFRSTEEIKAGGHVIVGLVHEDAGHLGIFVSGKVAQKETRQLVATMEAIELLQPGLYGMEIVERAGKGGLPAYDVRFREYRLEEVVARLNPLRREDEQPFRAVEAVSELNQRAYEILLRPFVRSVASDWGAKLLRDFHPLRLRNWVFADGNPAVAWLEPAARAVKAGRRPEPPESPLRRAEALAAEMGSAAIDFHRALRDAFAEATFFTIYGNAFLAWDEQSPVHRRPEAPAVEARRLPAVRQALARIERGGYPEAFARLASLLAATGDPIPISLLGTARALIHDYRAYLPAMPPEEARRIRGEQEIIVRYEPERALETLPRLVGERDRARLRDLIELVIRDKRMLAHRPTARQLAMLERVRAALGSPHRRRKGRSR